MFRYIVTNHVPPSTDSFKTFPLSQLMRKEVNRWMLWNVVAIGLSLRLPGPKTDTMQTKNCNEVVFLWVYSRAWLLPLLMTYFIKLYYTLNILSSNIVGTIDGTILFVQVSSWFIVYSSSRKKAKLAVTLVFHVIANTYNAKYWTSNDFQWQIHLSDFIIWCNSKL